VTSHRVTAHTSVRATMANALRLTRAGFVPYLVAILLLQGAIVLLAVPAIGGLFRLVLDSSGLSGLSDRTLLTALADPLSFILLLAIAVIALATVSLQFSTIIVMANRQQAGLPLCIRGIARDVRQAARTALSYQSPLLFAYFFVIAPIGGFGVLSTLTRGIAIPPFVTGEFMKTALGAAGYMAVIGIAIYLNLRLILILPSIVVAGRSPLGSIGMSFVATRRRTLRLAVLVGTPVLAASLLSSGVVWLLVGATQLADDYQPALAPALASASIGVGEVMAFLAIGCATVVIAQVLVAVCREHAGLGALAAPVRPRATDRRVRRLAPRLLIRLGVGLSVVAISLGAAPATATPVHGLGHTLVIAHRGFVGGGVENTIGALEAAAALHPDLVETDMQQTKDGRFVASHDSNLLMVAHENVNIFDLTFDEATSIVESVGGFTGTIPSMVDYVTRARELGVKLLIELKVTGHESPDYIDEFLAELDSVGVTDDNVYHSLSADAVAGLKERRPELSVGYTIAMNIGDVPQDVPCDFYVVEQASYTPEFLAQARAESKPLYVWTVNDDKAIRDFLRVPVDGIVSDHPDLVQQERALLVQDKGLAPHVRNTLDYLSIF